MNLDLNYSDQYIVGLTFSTLGNTWSTETSSSDFAPEIKILLQSCGPNIQKEGNLLQAKVGSSYIL